MGQGGGEGGGRDEKGRAHSNCRRCECQERGTQWDTRPPDCGAGNLLAPVCGTHLPALGSALPRRLQLGPDLQRGPGRLLPTGQTAGQEKMLYSKPTSAGSLDEANEQLWKFRSQWQGKARQKPQQLQRDPGPNPASTGRLRDQHMPGPHGPCPAASKLMVSSKHPPRHTECLCQRALAQHP